MTFTKATAHSHGADRSRAFCANTDVWAVFRALRDARAHFGLKPAHLQTLQAMLSFLKPGQGLTVFAANTEICRRIGGIDERTLRRHIDRFIALGFMARHDSPNGKRYRVRATDGRSLSFGLSIQPLIAREEELQDLAERLEVQRRECLFLRKHILVLLARIEEHNPDHDTLAEVRKLLRRKLSEADYRALLRRVEALGEGLSTAVDVAETPVLPANDGQDARHLSKSEKERIDRKTTAPQRQPSVPMLTAVCKEASDFAPDRLETWDDVERHARTLAPMMGIHPANFEKAQQAVGTVNASSAIFVILQMGRKVRNTAAYFASLTLGNRQDQFDPAALLSRLARSQAAEA